VDRRSIVGRRILIDQVARPVSQHKIKIAAILIAHAYKAVRGMRQQGEIDVLPIPLRDLVDVRCGCLDKSHADQSVRDTLKLCLDIGRPAILAVSGLRPGGR
jgi:hypothetical protein